MFHGLTDGMGAMNFLKRLVEHYLILGETAGPEKEKAGSQEEKDRQVRLKGRRDTATTAICFTMIREEREPIQGMRSRGPFS